MSTTQIVQSGQDITIQADLYKSFELCDKKWQLTMSDGRHGASRYSVEAGDMATAVQCICKAQERFKLLAPAKVSGRRAHAALQG